MTFLSQCLREVRFKSGDVDLWPRSASGCLVGVCLLQRHGGKQADPTAQPVPEVGCEPLGFAPPAIDPSALQPDRQSLRGPQDLRLQRAPAWMQHRGADDNLALQLPQELAKPDKLSVAAEVPGRMHAATRGAKLLRV